MQLCKSNECFDSQLSLKYWLLKVAKNKSLDVVRSAYHRSEVSFDHASLRELGESRERSPGSTANTESAGEVLERCIAQLPTKQRIVLHLFYVDGRCSREISEITGLSVSHVNLQLHRARKKIRKLLEEKP